MGFILVSRTDIYTVITEEHYQCNFWKLFYEEVSVCVSIYIFLVLKFSVQSLHIKWWWCNRVADTSIVNYLWCSPFCQSERTGLITYVYVSAQHLQWVHIPFHLDKWYGESPLPMLHFPPSQLCQSASEKGQSPYAWNFSGSCIGREKVSS